MFRFIQFLSVSTILAMWTARTAMHPGVHPMLLVFAAVLAISTEVSYRAGQNNPKTAATK